MPRLHRTSPLAVLVFAVTGGAIGLLLQLAISVRGNAPLVPPLSLAFTLLVIAAMLVGFGIALRRAVSRGSGKPVNPFHAVRLLAAAKAGQFAGALLGGLGGGLALQLLTRSVMPPVGTWLPMLLVLVSGALLVAAGIITELLCRVPPSDPEKDEDRAAGIDPEPDAA